MASRCSVVDIQSRSTRRQLSVADDQRHWPSSYLRCRLWSSSGTRLQRQPNNVFAVGLHARLNIYAVEISRLAQQQQLKITIGHIQ